MVRVILATVMLILHGAIVLAAPVNKNEDGQVKVVEEYNNYKTNAFSWGYELSDGQEVSQNAFSIALEDGTKDLRIIGSYSYVAPNGVKYTVMYKADKNGYHPKVIVGDKPLAGTSDLFGPSSAYIHTDVVKSLLGR